MPRLPKKFYFLLLSAFILGAAYFTYQHYKPASVSTLSTPAVKGQSITR